MADKFYPNSELPIRKTSELLPQVFQTDTNDKFLSGVLDPLVQPGVLDKVVGYIGRRYGKTYKGSDIYLDTDQTLRSRYQLEPAVTVLENGNVNSFYDYLDFKNQLKFFGNNNERDDKITNQEHYSWNPPIEWDKFINYREYYWMPQGPLSVSVVGQSKEVQSTYRVSVSTGESWVFSPDGLTNNPSITLYRGQTYQFIVSSPDEGFTIRTNYDTGSLLFNPNKIYFPGELAVFDNKLWKAIEQVSPVDGSSIDINSQDWELIDSNVANSSLNYDDGVVNNGVTNGTLTFTVPLDAPDVLFYQSDVLPDRLGRFIIANIEANTAINIENEILGKVNYTSSNEIVFSNGLLVEFLGEVTPEKYANSKWVINGVGKSITLTNFEDLVPPNLTATTPEILFDAEGFDTQPFDDATQFPVEKDYITISQDSKDLNPWSRYNRWFHRSIIEYAAEKNGESFNAPEQARARRPIIEFNSNIKLFNHGSIAKTTVDYVDTVTTDIFSNIEGSTGYSIDGEFLFEGARILVINDRDSLANNKIYEVKFITHNSSTFINLQETEDSDSIVDECVLVRRGTLNSGSMFFFNGTNWTKSQEKTSVNQSPLFDAYDINGVSFSDTETYPVSTFTGTKLLNYKTGNGIIDTELGFSLSYLNIDNVGDIEFEWSWDVDSFEYTENQVVTSLEVKKGFYKVESNFDNGWIKTDSTYIQPIIDSIKIETTTNQVEFNTVNWNELTDLAVINFYLNGEKLTTSYTRQNNEFVFNTSFNENDILVIKVIDNIEPDQGYYEIPTGLEKNPLNRDIITFTLGQAIDHVSSALEFDAGFTNTVPGNSDLRDLDSYRNKTQRFIKHGGISAIPMVFLCDKNQNLIKSLQYAKQSYTSFKNNFLETATRLNFVENTADFVDTIINELTKTKTTKSPFIESDMIGSGAFTSIDYIVEDEGIKTFTLSENFDLDNLSNRAVYVYLNGVQLLHNNQYTFDSTFGFVTLTTELSRGDSIQIREYVSTAYSHIPPTPTSMGLYKKYTPTKFIDDTYIEPKEVIQGHDGSITAAFGDFRDDLLLELEYRIYNNIKITYDTSVFDIDSILGGYNQQGEFTKTELDFIVSQEFLNWISNTGENYAANRFFDSENPFTYTYSNMTDSLGTQNLPGYWRGVYQWVYDTDRPHRAPWEILGFSEKPNWWDNEYGSAPYTRGNLLLWEDIRDGIIRQGARAGRYARYARPTILNHIPVDDAGNLLDPLTSGLATNFTLVNNQGSFKLGDVAPVEYAWRSSSEWPFAVLIALSLLKPFDFITRCIDKSSVTTNKLGQIINKETNYFVGLSDVNVPSPGGKLTSGLINYLASYVRSLGLDSSVLLSTIQNINVSLSSRLSGFVDKTQQKYLLDSKNPSSTTGSIFIPPENYDIIFNTSSPIQVVSYSGVILEKTANGWIVTGYDSINPYFNFYDAVPNQKDPLIKVGGISETFVNWTANQKYNNGAIVLYRNDYYRALQTHESEEFNFKLWNKLVDLPVKNSVEAHRRRNFNKLKLKQITYGHEFNTIQQVVDFLLGYEEYLKSIGFVFDNYDTENQVSQDWTTSCKEFMFWTKHNWADGSIITLSPAASKLKVIVPVGVVDNLLDSFYDYNVLKGDGTPLDIQFIDVNREFQTFTINTTNTNQGIYFLQLNYVLKEHVVVFDDRTVFNDVIYDKTTGYRQGRIKSRGFRTVDWDGDYTSPGFLFDNVNIEAWQPFRDYNLGDIVSYRSINWVSIQTHSGLENFDNTVWSRLDSEPEKRLVPNFDYRINQFEDYFETGSDGVDAVQRQLARNTIGYQERPYLNELSEDGVTQFKLYQGFIREKGTTNSLIKLFNKLSENTEEEKLILNEEWAFKVGEFGGSAQTTETEFEIEIDNFEINPQPLLITTSIPSIKTDQFYRIVANNFTIAPIPYNENIIPKSYDAEPVKTAGYVKLDQTDWTIKDRASLNTLDISQIKENDYIWITFDGPSWTVLKFNQIPGIYANNFILDQNNFTVQIILNKETGLNVGEYCGIKNVTNLTGFFEIVRKETVRNSTGRSFVLEVSVPEGSTKPEFDESTLVDIYALTESRFSDYTVVDPQTAALLDENNKLWIDNNGNNQWEVIEKKKQFVSKQITNFGLINPTKVGTKVLYNSILNQSIVSIPDPGFVVMYTESANGLSVREILGPSLNLADKVSGIFASEIAISPDSKWLAVGTPLASGIESKYRGPYLPTESYQTDDIVLYEGKLWKALTSQSRNPGANLEDSTWIGPSTENWEPATIIKAEENSIAPGYTEQGLITLYEYVNNRWTRRDSFVSPRPVPREYFGSSISIGVSNNNYYMAVSAPGAEEDKGRVYLYIHDGTEWKHAENVKYRGIYDESLPVYYAGDIVWYDGNLFECLDNSTEYVDISKGIDLSYTGNWIKLNPVATQNSLPQSVSIEDDGSTLQSGILSSDQMAELVKIGDKFGTDIAMNYDGSILVVGAPFADGQYFPNYKGFWSPNYQYTEGDVVKWQGIYHQLTNIGPTQVDADSTITSFNQEPGGHPWVETGDSSTNPSGKIFVYQRSEYGTYELKQTVSSENFINDSGTNIAINTGDEFGTSVDIDHTGTTIVASSPKSDMEFKNQGSAYILRTSSVDLPQYRLVQKIQSYEKYPNEFFGYNISISPDTSKIAIGANNAQYTLPVRFDSSSTQFDEGRSNFYSNRGTNGAVYVYELKDGIYFLTEKLEANLSIAESFGHSIDCTNSVIVVGSPFYGESNTTETGLIEYTGDITGTVRTFRKDPAKNSWEIIAQQTPVVEINKIKSISLYDNVNNVKIIDLDYVDPAKLKILNEAEQEIEYKTPYDPAVYSIGTETSVVDPDVAWTTKNIGKLWWDLSTVKWIYYEQGDISYRTGNWGVLAEGASIDVYEWVETTLLPSDWAVLADTNEGLAEGISGQPLYADDSVYSTKILFNDQTFEPTETLYYYWVKNKVVVPSNVTGRRISSASVSNLIENPSANNTFVAIADSNKLINYNYKTVIDQETALLNFEFYNNIESQNNVHKEYQLISEGVADSLPTGQLELKWIDSLIGYDKSENRVPDTDLPAKQKYGLNFRPRQSMFVDRIPILKTTIINVNSVLNRQPFADIINFDNLNLVDQLPSESLNLYDLSVDSLIDLETVGTVRIKQAVLRANLIDGSIDTIDIVDPGYGYRPRDSFKLEAPGLYEGPPIEFEGSGTDAKAVSHIDGQGRIVNVIVVNAGKNYESIITKVRNFSVLVESDSTSNGFWSIYAWDDVRKTFFRSRSQAFDTTRYWSLEDWWKEGFSPTSRVVKEIISPIEELVLDTKIGDLIRIKEYGSGGWAVFLKTTDESITLLDNYELVGREKGTVQLSSGLYDTSIEGIGFDNINSFDSDLYDLSNSRELRNIFTAIKEDIFIGDYAVEWNNLFFTAIRYAFAEQAYVDWAFKTSFLNAIHNVGSLRQKINYKNDSLESYKQYIDEVKPYKTNVREYTSRYTSIENTQTIIGDFDLPPVYSELDGKIIPISQSSFYLDQYPWKFWKDNQGYSIESIQLANKGSGYIQPPSVLIQGNGTGASARAYISNGSVVAIRMINQGSGYTNATITLVGGNDNASTTATAVPILGNSVFRNLNLTIKFDRYTKEGLYQNVEISDETFIANGQSSVFDLKYAPTIDKSKISITRNGQVVLDSEYRISLFTSTTDTYSLIKGKIIFNESPAFGDEIVINYEKNDELLDSVNRINKYYTPLAGMKGKELNQLMTGIDFGGVQVQGTTFDVTGGWDALPWFTDNWDSVEASSDYYVVADGSTTDVTLPYVPADTQQINIYLKRSGDAQTRSIDDLQYSQEILEPETIRIDDPEFGTENQTNENALMPTFVGDGSTSTVNIGEYVRTNAGDILIFRPTESDGSVTITDTNIVDTNMSGGTLSAMQGAYSTATGLTAEEIVIDGDQFINPDQVPAPEEQVPGQVLDGVSIKVFTSDIQGSSSLKSKVIYGDNSTISYEIGQTVVENNSVIVYIDKVLQTPITDYLIDANTNSVIFNEAPTSEELIEIVSIGLGGLSIIDYQEFVANGDTSVFVTKARYNDTSSVYVTVNGEPITLGFLDSEAFDETPGLTTIQFAEPPLTNSVIKIVSIGGESEQQSLIKINQQIEIFDGSSRSFEIANFINSSRKDPLSSIIVEVNDVALQGVDTDYFTVSDENLTEVVVRDGELVTDVYNEYRFVIGTDPLESAGSILTENIRVTLNDIELTVLSDYIFDGINKVLIFDESKLKTGDILKIENSFRTEFSLQNNTLTINSNVTMNENDTVNIIWFDEYPSMELLSDEYSGEQVNYLLKYQPISSEFVWVYKNGVRLTSEFDYALDENKQSIYLKTKTLSTDRIKIIIFGIQQFRLTSAYEIHKDMLNVYRYKRYSSGDVILSKNLNYYDTSIEVSNGALLGEPNKSRNIPGIIEINKEKIEYFEKNGNILSQLRRGANGTAISEVIERGTEIADLGVNEIIPYTESQDRYDFYTDGSSNLFGPLPFIPNKTEIDNWYRGSSEPGEFKYSDEYGQCNDIEVFVGGKRLRKNPTSVYNETLGASSPTSDILVEAEFAVDGTTNEIYINPSIFESFIDPADPNRTRPSGIRVTVIRRTGKTWQDKGETTVTTGVTLLENESAIAKFIAQKTTELPE